ncbi:uncharacterized protein A1O9_12866 [Exophiala aquamarina CBS 119918]|uniref:3-oxoacyl-[acyl-carrier protein] reductase n=1 Tax=Exophiala aquamarina CBS 119918 TaxID=1182545 RepID=A0A072NT76_9EURO|nr:uncharacterized protein A1O9_12866 [Exophiala aquamarina CBS 119918]KEF51084.1 hypothetical protein A1O9_12866 [Exophiala aquamarina CBS 119918]
MDSLLSGVALVTGASSGIGRATCIALAKHGVTKFALLDRDSEGGELTIQKLKDVPGERECLFIQVDMSDHNAVTTAVAEAVARFQRIDYAVSNVGIAGPIGSSLTFSPVELQHILNVNLVSQFALQKELLVHMQKQSIPPPTGCALCNSRFKDPPQRLT